MSVIEARRSCYWRLILLGLLALVAAVGPFLAYTRLRADRAAFHAACGQTASAPASASCRRLTATVIDVYSSDRQHESGHFIDVTGPAPATGHLTFSDANALLDVVGVNEPVQVEVWHGQPWRVSFDAQDAWTTDADFGFTSSLSGVIALLIAGAGLIAAGALSAGRASPAGVASPGLVLGGAGTPIVAPGRGRSRSGRARQGRSRSSGSRRAETPPSSARRTEAPLWWRRLPRRVKLVAAVTGPPFALTAALALAALAPSFLREAAAVPATLGIGVILAAVAAWRTSRGTVTPVDPGPTAPGPTAPAGRDPVADRSDPAHPDGDGTLGEDPDDPYGVARDTFAPLRAKANTRVGTVVVAVVSMIAIGAAIIALISFGSHARDRSAYTSAVACARTGPDCRVHVTSTVNEVRITNDDHELYLVGTAAGQWVRFPARSDPFLRLLSDGDEVATERWRGAITKVGQPGQASMFDTSANPVVATRQSAELTASVLVIVLVALRLAGWLRPVRPRWFWVYDLQVLALLLVATVLMVNGQTSGAVVGAIALLGAVAARFVSASRRQPEPVAGAQATAPPDNAASRTG